MISCPYIPIGTNHPSIDMMMAGHGIPVDRKTSDDFSRVLSKAISKVNEKAPLIVGMIARKPVTEPSIRRPVGYPIVDPIIRPLGPGTNPIFGHPIVDPIIRPSGPLINSKPNPTDLILRTARTASKVPIVGKM